MSRRSANVPLDIPKNLKRDSALRATLDAFGNGFSSKNRDYAKDTKRREISGFYSSFGDMANWAPKKGLTAARDKAASELSYSSLASGRESISKIYKRREIGGHYTELNQRLSEELRAKAEEELMKFML